MSGRPNLEVLQPSRKAPRVGDIFGLSPQDSSYLFGRVVATDAVEGTGANNLLLIYIYQGWHETLEVRPADLELTPLNLLVPPMVTNRLPWSRGYFQTLANAPLRKDQRLPVHCFVDIRGRYFDEYGKELARAFEPVGVKGVHSFRTIDDAVSEALGIRPAAD